MTNFLVSLIVAFWISAIALLSVQNAAPVTLRFLTFQSVQMPLGIVVAFGAAFGTVGMALVLPSLKPSRSTQREDFEE
ncbi:MAG: LapA family protein [Oculatellaceae cyanobacterium bins.114]|nr:LapA family protein [Oculatellaceae cyanobacterium bins.114]